MELSERELVVLRESARSSNDYETAEALAISPHTLAGHLSSLLAKTGCTDRANLIRWGRENGLLGDA